MFFRILWGVFATVALIASVFASFGDYEMDNNNLTMFTMLAIFLIYVNMSIKEK